MLVRFLRDQPVSYDQIHTVIEEKGTERDIKDDLGKSMIRTGAVEEIVMEKEKEITEEKQVDAYENKMVKKYNNKAVKAPRGRPSKVKKNDFSL